MQSAKRMSGRRKGRQIKRLAQVSLAVLLVAAIVLTLAWAFENFSPAKAGPTSQGLPSNAGARLHDDFIDDDYSQPVNGLYLYDKDVYVENFGDEPLLVRVRFWEYMEVTTKSGATTVYPAGAVRSDPSTWTLHRNADGPTLNINPNHNQPYSVYPNRVDNYYYNNSVPFAYYASDATASNTRQQPCNSSLHGIWKWYMGNTANAGGAVGATPAHPAYNPTPGRKYFLPTENLDDTGRPNFENSHLVDNIVDDIHYGAGVYTGMGRNWYSNALGTPGVDGENWGGAAPALARPINKVNPFTSAHANRVFNRDGKPVQQTIAGHRIVKMYDWCYGYNSTVTTGRNGTNGPIQFTHGTATVQTPWWPGDFWVEDTDGWYYWCNNLMPGTATNLLLDQVERISDPCGGNPDSEYYYGIHVELEAFTWDDAGLTQKGKGYVNDGSGITAAGARLLHFASDHLAYGIGTRSGASGRGVESLDRTDNNHIIKDTDDVEWLVLDVNPINNQRGALLMRKEPIGSGAWGSSSTTWTSPSRPTAFTYLNNDYMDALTPVSPTTKNTNANTMGSIKYRIWPNGNIINTFIVPHIIVNDISKWVWPGQIEVFSSGMWQDKIMFYLSPGRLFVKEGFRYVTVINALQAGGVPDPALGLGVLSTTSPGPTLDGNPQRDANLVFLPSQYDILGTPGREEEKTTRASWDTAVHNIPGQGGTNNFARNVLNVAETYPAFSPMTVWDSGTNQDIGILIVGNWLSEGRVASGQYYEGLGLSATAPKPYFRYASERIAYVNGTPVPYWTRSSYLGYNQISIITDEGELGYALPGDTTYDNKAIYYRPCIVIDLTKFDAALPIK